MQKFTKPFYLLLCSFFLLGFSAAAQVAANFTANHVSGCAPLVVQFTNTSTGNITAYSWNLGNSVTTTLANPSTTYTSPGTYTVTLTVSGPGGTNTKTVTNYITVYSEPTVAFTGNVTSGCGPLTVQFTSTSTPNAPGGMTYSWDFGDGYAATTQNPTHTYTVPGVYHPSLVVTNSVGCSKTLVKPNYIEVFGPPNGNFIASSYFFCDAPATVTFTNITTGTGPYTISWLFGDGNTGTGATPTHTYALPGSYTVTMYVTDGNGCLDTVVKPGLVQIGSSAASFTGPATACPFQVVTFTNTTPGIVNSSWTFGDGGTSTVNNPQHAYAAPGIYDVKLVTLAGGCLDSVTQQITIHPQPVADFTGVPLIPCPAPSSVQFTSTSTGAVSYFWDFGDGGTSTQANPSHLYAANGFFDVTLVVTNANGCTDTIVKQDYIKIYNMILQAASFPEQGCVPLTVTMYSALRTNDPTFLMPYPVPITSYLWTFGDGSPNSSLAQPTHTYTLYGNYQVTLTVTTANGCTISDTFVINVGSLPAAGFTATPLVVCPRDSVKFTNTSTGALTYLWDFGDGNLSPAINPTHKYNVSGTYTVTLHAYNNGCEDTATITNYIVVNPASANFLDSVYCPPSKNVQFKNLSINPTSVIWDFGDGTPTSTQLNPLHTYAAFGTYQVKLITYNSVYGCHDTLIRPVDVLNPQMSFVANDTAICRDDTVYLTASYTGMVSKYQWRLGGQFFSDTTAVLPYSFHQPGFYPVTLRILNDKGCLDSLVKPNYMLVAKPDAGFSATPVLGCTPMNVTFTDTTKYTTGTWAVNRSWTFGTGGTASNNNVTTAHLYPNAGVYDVQLIVTDNVGCKDTLERFGYIEARKPVADFYADDTGACPGQQIQFVSVSTGVTVLAHSWDFGDNSTGTGALTAHTYYQPGSYTVRLIVTDATGCKDTLIRTSYVGITKPNASFNLSDTLAVCPPLLVYFTNTTTGATSYIWNFGNGNPSYITNPTNTYSTSGTFNVQLIATNANGCTDTATAQVKVLGYAGALSYGPLSGCSPLQVNFTAAITNVPNLVWDFSDGVTTPAIGATISHVYTNPGAYVPKLIFSDGLGCTSSSIGLDTIKVDGVDAGFTIAPPCERSPVQFTDTSHTFFSAITGRQWLFHTGGPVSGTTVFHTYPSAGTYPVRLIVTNANGCKDTVLRQVVIHPLPVINAQRDTAVCPGDPAPLSVSGGQSYTWSPATGLSCINCPDPVATPAAPTVYLVSGTDVNGCVNVDSVRVNIQLKTTSDATGGGEICQGQTIKLQASGAQTYQWFPAATLDNSTIPNPVASPWNTTNYMVVAREGSCPPDTNFVRVIVHLRPTVNAGADQTVIAGNSVTLQASGTGIDHYEWLPDPTLSCYTCSGPTAAPKVTTTYTVTAYNDYGCTDTDEVVVRIVCDQSQVFIPNTFTPNGDGQNDFFFARGKGVDKILSFRVYTRWGEVVYERNGFNINEETAGWDGTHKGALLNPDVYVYVMEATCVSGETVQWKGDVTLMR